MTLGELLGEWEQLVKRLDDNVQKQKEAADQISKLVGDIRGGKREIEQDMAKVARQLEAFGLKVGVPDRGDYVVVRDVITKGDGWAKVVARAACYTLERETPWPVHVVGRLIEEEYTKKE